MSWRCPYCRETHGATPDIHGPITCGYCGNATFPNKRWKWGDGLAWLIASTTRIEPRNGCRCKHRMHRLNRFGYWLQHAIAGRSRSIRLDSKRKR